MVQGALTLCLSFALQLAASDGGGGGARNSAKLKTAVVPRAMELCAATTVLSLQGV